MWVKKHIQISTLAQNQKNKFITIIYDLMVVYPSIKQVDDNQESKY
jgi:hypothetical protein